MKKIKKKIIKAMALILFIFMGVSTLFGGDVTFFGPKQYTRNKEKPITESDIFVCHPNYTGPGFTLRLLNGDSQGKHRVSSAVITFNGIQVMGPSDFNQQKGYIERTVSLNASNEISVKLNSKPGSYVTIDIFKFIPEPEAIFTASPETIPYQQWSNLSWDVIDADVINIDNGIGIVGSSGSVQVSPEVPTTTYTLTATNLGGTTTQQVTVTVIFPVPTMTFNASPLIIQPGSSSTLSWASFAAHTMTIEPGIGTVALNGSLTVYPTATTTYTLSAVGYGGTQNAAAVVTIDGIPPQIDVTEPMDGAYLNHPDVSVKGQVIDSSPVTLKVNGNDVPLQGENYFEVPLQLNEGANTITLAAADAAGNTGTTQVNVVIDTAAPQVEITDPVNNAIIREIPISITGTITEIYPLKIVLNNTIEGVISNDQFTFTNVTLMEGENLLTVIGEDKGGNTDSAFITVTYVPDSDPPEITITFPRDGIFQDTPEVRVFGTVIDPSDIAYVRVNGNDALLDGDNYSYTLPLSEGENLITVESADVYQNQGSTSVSITLDTLLPRITVSQPEAGAYLNTPQVVVKGEVEDVSPVTLTINGTGVVLQDKNFETILQLMEGANPIKIEAEDGAGNSITNELKIFADTTEPVIEITSPSDNTFTNSDKITVSGKITDENPLKITVNSIEGEIIGSHFYSRDIPLQEGENTLEFLAEDRAGNTNQVPYSITITKDTVVPQLTILSPLPGSLISQKTILVRGTVTDAFLKDVKVNNYNCPVETNEFNRLLNLVEGLNTINIIVSDTAGNIKTESVTVNVDTYPPLINVNTPQNNALLNTHAVTVSGRADDTNLSAVKINGQIAALNNNEFTLSSLSLQEGENQVTVEAEDGAGNTSSQVLTLILDTTAPGIVSVIPPDNSTRVQLSQEIRVEFSETIDEAVLSDQTFYLESGGQKINGTITREENQLVFNAAGSLPDSSEITIHVTTGIKDLAGNPVQNPYTGVFFTCDTTAPEAPQVGLLPETTSLNEITVSGTAEKGAGISISGGFSLVQGMCDDQGNFSIEVTLKQGQLNQLCLYASDGSGNESIPTCVFIYQEDSEFVILGASFENNEVRVTFSKPIEPTTLTSDNFMVSSTNGPESGTISFSAAGGGTIGIFTPSNDLGSQPVMVEVKTGVTDAEGIALSYPFTKVFNREGGEVIAQGEVYDDSSGLPLGGALIRLVNIDGVLPLEPVPSAVTTKEGKYVIILPSGQSILRISREGYTYSDRVVLTAPGFSSSVFDSRLTPFNSDEQAIVLEGGIIKSFVGGPGGRFFKRAPLAAGGIVIYPAGAVDSEKIAQFTVVGAQSLQGRLPSGWSPLAVFDLRINGESQGGSGLLKPCQLRTSNQWSGVSPSSLVLAHWDEVQFKWKAVSGVSVSPEEIIGTIEMVGQYAFLLKDTVPVVPPQPVIGEFIAGVPQGTLPVGSGITALLNFKPSDIYPEQTSTAVLNITTSTAVSSGVPLQAKVRENYALLAGSDAAFAPYRADLTAYNYGTSVLNVEFNLSPNRTMSLSQLKRGAIKVDMVRYAAGGLGVVVGPDGGTVSGDGGAEIIIEQGSVDSPIAVTVKKLEGTGLTVQIPSGFEPIGAMDLSLGGASLLKPAVLSLSLTQEEMDNIPADAPLFIVRLEKLDYELSWVLKSQGIAANSRIKSFIDTNNNLPFPGVIEGGTYLFLRALSPVGFLTGTVLSDSQPLHNAIVSADNHEIKSVSAQNYVQIGFMGSLELAALNRATRDRGSGAASIQSAGEIIPLDITIEKTGPEIAAITPINDAADVPLNSKITFIFSEPIRASTFNAETVVIKKGGERVEGVLKLSIDSKQGEFIPNGDFASDSTINIIVTTGLQDFHANGMSREFTSRFHTVDIVPPEADLSKIKVLIPENGNAVVTGGPGSVEPGTSVTVYNERTGVAVTVNGLLDGSFFANIGAEISDKLKITVIDPAGNETIFANKPFVSADGRRMVVDSSGGEFITPAPESLGIKIEEGTFAGPVNVGVYQESDPAILAPVPEGIEALNAVRVDFSGYTPARAFKLSIPLPDGVPVGTDAELFFAREVTVFGEKKLMVVDTASIENNRIRTNSPPFLGCTAAGVFRVIWNRFLELGFGTGRVMRPDVVVTAGEFVYVCGTHTLDFIMPVYIGKDVTLTVKDIDTGETLYEKTSPALTMKGQVYSFGGLGDEKDMEPPYLIRSVGIKSLSFDVTSKGFSSQGITVTPTINNGIVESITIIGEPGTSVVSTSRFGRIHIYKSAGQGIVQMSPPDGFEADFEGSFEENVEAETGDRIFMTVEEDNIPIDQEFVLSFSEPIKDPDEAGENSIILYEIDEETNEEKKVEIYTERLDSETDIHIRPKNLLRDNIRYKFEIKDLVDQSNNPGNKLFFDSYFRTFRSERIGSFNDLNTVYGSVRYGSYLYVASGDFGIDVLDVSNPSDIKRVGKYMGTGTQFRGVALYDGPGQKKKLVVVGGGYRFNGHLSILDLSDPIHPQQEKFMYISRARTGSRDLPEGKPGNISVIGNYAFVPIFGSGLQVIDLLKLLTGTAHEECRIGFYMAQGAEEVRAYRIPATEYESEKVIAVLLEDRYGVHIIDFTNALMPIQIGRYLFGSTIRSGSLEVALDYPVELNGDGKYEENEKKDLLFFSMLPYSYIYVVDITDVVEKQPVVLTTRLIKKIKIDGQSIDYIFNMDIDVRDKTLAVTDSNNGLVLLDMRISIPEYPDPENIIDDTLDRVMAKISSGGTTSRQGLIWDKDLNIAYLGKSYGKVEAIKLGNPRIQLVYDVVFDTGTHKLHSYKEVIRIAPSGIKDKNGLPDEIYVMAFLPGGVTKKTNVDSEGNVTSTDHKKAVCELWSLNSSNVPIIPWDKYPLEGPPAGGYFKNLELFRLSDNSYYDEYNIFLSKPIRVTLDPDETREIEYIDQYGATQRSDLRLLSGDMIWTHISGLFITEYGLENYISVNDSSDIGDRKFSVRADLIDRKENFDFEGVPVNAEEKPNSPTNNPSIYSGVLLHSGEFVFDDIDIHIPGRGFDFVFKRTYRSQCIYSGVLGWGWDHNYNKRLLELPSRDIIYFDGSGRRERYKVNGQAGTYKSPAGRFTELKKMYDGTFRHIFSNRTIEFFDSFGRLIKIQDRNQNKMEFYYDLSGQLSAVMDTMGRLIEFEYNPSIDETTNEVKPDSGRLIAIIDFSGRKVEFTYDNTTGDLIERDFMGRIKKYRYSTNDNEIRLAHNMEKIIDPRGAASDSPVLTVTYDGEDKVDKQRFIEMDADIDFTIGETSTTVTDARGNPKIFNFPTDTRLEVTNGGHTFKYEFNDDHLVTKIEFPGGNSVTYNYYPAAEEKRRSAGNLVSVVSTGSDGSITTTYESETYWNQVEGIIDPKGNETKITHDGNGNIDTVTLPGIEQPYDYDYYTPGEPRICGVLKSITDPEGSVTEYEYYPENNPSGDGSSPPWNRDMNTTIGGYLKKVTVDKGGVNISTSYKYDQLGNLEETEDGEGVKTTYHYDNPFGEVSTLVQGATGSNDGAPPASLTTTFKYDANGCVDLEISSTGITIDYNYDRLNRMTTKTYKGGTDVMTYGFKYDNNSNLKEVTYPDGVRKDTFTYNSRDLMETKTSGIGDDSSTIGYTYTDNARLHILTDGEGHEYEYKYDGYGRLKDIIDPLENKVTYSYDLNSNLRTVDVAGSDGQALNLEYDYDILNRITHHKLKKGDGAYITTGFGYNAASHLNSMTTPNNHHWDIKPNGVGFPAVITDPIGNSDGNSYDKRGLPKGVVEFESGGRSLSHSLRYTVLGDIWRSGDSINRDYKYEYHPDKHVMDTAKDPAGGLVSYGYDGLNRISTVTRHIQYESGFGEAVTRYKYDANGNVERIIDAGNNETRCEYDSRDRLTDIYYPGTTGSIHFTYNKNDQVNTSTDLNGTVVTNTYDEAGRLTYREIAQGAGVAGSTYEDFDFDGLGRLTRAENSDSEVTFEYNTAGRLILETQNIKDSVGSVIATYVVGCEYDDNGNRTKLTYPSKIDPSNSDSPIKEVVYIPDQLDRIDTITSGSNIIADYNYEGKAKVTSKKLANEKVVMTSIYDDGRRPLTLTYKSGGNTLFNSTMGWNLMDMKLTDTGLDTAKEYKYDTGWRLRRENNTKDELLLESLEFVIDGVENLKYIQPAPIISASTDYQVLRCQHNEKHQVSSVDYKQTVGNNAVNIHVEPSYDSNGNMKSFVHQYTYNYRDQLIEVVTGTGVIVRYKYDALGRRIEKSVTDPDGEEITRYVHDGWRVIEERDNNDNVKARYTYGNGIDERVELEYDVNNTLTPFIPMQDSIGNVIGIADETGKMVEKYTYSTYGSPVFDYDNTPPKVENVYVIDGMVITVYSESIKVGSGTSSIVIKREGSELSGTFEQNEDGKELSFIPSTPLEPGQISIDIDESIEDQSGNQLGSSFSRDFVYTGATTVGYDSSPPEVYRIEQQSNEYIITFTEIIDSNTVSSSIEIKKADGSVSGSVSIVDGRSVKFTPDEVLGERKEYALWVYSTLKDLSGKSINEFFHAFVVLNDDMLIFEKSDPNRHSTSNIGNNYLFHGRTYEPEVGLYFYRHRYYLPRLGRFLQTDPMGYEDSMNLYQAFNQNPVNFVDPMGKDIVRGKYVGASTEEREKMVKNFVDKGRSRVELWLKTPKSPAADMQSAALEQHIKNTYTNLGLAGILEIPVVGPPFVAGYATRSIGEGYIGYVKQRWNHVSVLESGTSIFFKRASAPFMALLDLIGISGGVRAVTDGNLSDEERGRLLMDSYNQLSWTSIGGYYGWKFFKTKSDYVRVGRWMSKLEYENMLDKQRVQEGGGGLTFASTEGPGSFMKQAPKGSVYVEYDVPANSLLPGGKAGWVKNIGPNAPKSQILMLNKKGGEMLPKAINIKLLMEKR